MTTPPPLIDPLDRDSHLCCASAAKLCPGKTPHQNTVWRWMKRGRRGIKLPSIPAKARGGRVTSREAIQWFFAELQQQEQQPTERPRRYQHDPQLDAACEAVGT